MLKMSSAHPRARHAPLLSGRAVAVCFGFASVLSIYSAIECHVFISGSIPNAAYLPSLIYGSVTWLWWAPLAVAIGLGLERRPRFGELSPSILALQTFMASVVACFHLRLLVFCVHRLVRRWPELWTAGYKELPLWSLGRAVPEVLLYLLLWAVGSALCERQKSHARELEALALRRSLTEAELFALQRQMQPHFLFNTFNSITGLLESGNHHAAREVVKRLSELTKRAVMKDLPSLVAVSDELEIIEAYLEIEQLRFGDRLQIEISIEPRALSQKMPPFLLQPLVENAVKHSTHQNLDGCNVRIWLTCHGERLALRITDNGIGSTASSVPGMGVSMENIRNRLGLQYRSDYSLEMRRLAEGGCEITVSLPLGSLSA